MIIIGIGLIITSFLLPKNDSIVENDDKDNITEEVNTIDFDNINNTLINNSYGSAEKVDKYDASSAYLWKSFGKIVDGQEVDGSVEVYYLVYENNEKALDFFNNFQSDFKHDIKEYNNYSVARYSFGGVITRYCYKVVSDKYAIFVLSYDKDEYDSVIDLLGYEKE